MFEVYLNDAQLSWDESEVYFHNANVWALENCESYVNYNVQDVSDVSYVYDNIGLYLFREERDVMIFKLKWER